LKNILKQWISLYPEKIMFGSDAFPFNMPSARKNLLAGGALRPRGWRGAGRTRCERPSPKESLELARLYLHDNAQVVWRKEMSTREIEARRVEKTWSASN